METDVQATEPRKSSCTPTLLLELLIKKGTIFYIKYYLHLFHYIAYVEDCNSLCFCCNSSWELWQSCPNNVRQRTQAETE